MNMTRVMNVLHYAVDATLNRVYGLPLPPAPDHFVSSRQLSLSQKMINVRAGRSADTPDHQWPENADPDRYGLTPKEAVAQNIRVLGDTSKPRGATTLSLQDLNFAASGTPAAAGTLLQKPISVRDSGASLRHDAT